MRSLSVRVSAIALSLKAKFEILQAKIRELDSYEVPEIIALPLIAGSAPYLAWISEQVN